MTRHPIPGVQTLQDLIDRIDHRTLKPMAGCIVVSHTMLARATVEEREVFRNVVRVHGLRWRAVRVLPPEGPHVELDARPD